MHPHEYAQLRRQAAPDLDDEALLNSAQVKQLCGGVSDMALWRWSRDERIRFPEPDVRLNGRKYWFRRSIRAWQTEHREQSKQAA